MEIYDNPISGDTFIRASARELTNNCLRMRGEPMIRMRAYRKAFKNRRNRADTVPVLLSLRDVLARFRFAEAVYDHDQILLTWVEK